MSINENKENDALDCLIAYTLRNCDQTEEDILRAVKEYETKDIKLSPSLRKALKNLENDIFEKPSLIKGAVFEEVIPESQYSAACLAMHRGKSSEEINPEIEKELTERRKRIIEDIKKKRDKTNGKQT
jgi:hypothetical protein